nr:HEAT repeat domain-containing protein [Metabacillus halosaccharovorans]
MELQDQFEPIALNAAYELARRGKHEELFDAIQSENVKVSRLAAYGLSVSSKEVIPGLIENLKSRRVETVIHTIFALGEQREQAKEAVYALNKLLKHPSEKVRRAVVEALGMIQQPTDDVVEGLCHCLKDEDVQVRFMAGLSLSRLGPSAEKAVPQLEIALNDENRYVRAHAAEALRYINTEQAKDVLIKFLFNSRWCPTTTKVNTFYP